MCKRIIFPHKHFNTSLNSVEYSFYKFDTFESEYNSMMPMDPEFSDTKRLKQ